MAQPAKARMVVFWQGGAETVDLQFNPTELSFEKSVQLAEINIPGLNAPLQQFVRGQSERLTIELLFDTTDEGMGLNPTSVTTHTDKIYALTRIDPKGHAPPLVTLYWSREFPGNQLPKQAGNQKRNSFTGLAESVRQRFTLFSPEGIPLRASVTLTLREFRNLDMQFREVNPSSPDRTHAHVVQRGDTLSGIAARYYLRPDDWREVARANGIEDPRRLAVGRVIAVPRIPAGQS